MRFSADTVRGARGVVVRGDNLRVLGDLAAELSGAFRLVYLDPPYNTGRQLAYEDRRSRSDWDTMIRERLTLVAPLLSPSGSVWAQIDDREEATLRLALDDTFGSDAFQNAIRWVYGGAARGAKAHARRLARNHDSLLVYAREPREFRMNPVRVRVGHSPDEARAKGFREDERGWFKTAPRGDYTDASIERLRAEGRIHESSSGAVRIRYALVSEGGRVYEEHALGDVRTDIPDMMHAPRAERVGFETQKPVALLQRVLALSTGPSDWILDPFGGSGTTALATVALNRADGGDRRFVLVEAGDHFEDVLLPRLTAALADDPLGLVVLRA
jgi:hypothetical protein